MYVECWGLKPVKIGGRDEKQMHVALFESSDADRGFYTPVVPRGRMKWLNHPPAAA